jgi:HD-like signal output (HDOD) protein
MILNSNAEDLASGKIELPSLPDLASKIRDALRDPKSPIDDVNAIKQLFPTPQAPVKDRSGRL